MQGSLALIDGWGTTQVAFNPEALEEVVQGILPFYPCRRGIQSHCAWCVVEHGLEQHFS